MESYSALAASYDELTQDVGYEKRAAFVEKLFLRSHIPVHTVLDLACGTGTMTALLTERGYELIGVDGSEDMLLEAREKAQTLTGVPPLFLHQSMPELDLYGTVEAAICCLDSLNYLTDAREVRETFRRLHLFIAPGGSLVFDVHALGKLEAMDGQVWLDERRCFWMRRMTPTACGARSIPAARACWTITLTFSPPARTAHGSAASRSTISAGTAFRS